MPDTITPKLSLVKPEIAGSPDTWGNKLNGNFDIIDSKMVRQTIQWVTTPGDDNPTSSTGPYKITRYGNDGLPIDDPFTINRQTGQVIITDLTGTNSFANKSSQNMSDYPLQAVNPSPPAVGNVRFFVDNAGNACVIKSDGTIIYLGAPPGTIAFTGASTADVGWALLNGQAISRSINPVLFTRYGTIFGPGDGSTTFNLPDAKGCVFAHADGGAGRLTAAYFGTSPVLGARGGLESNQLDVTKLPTLNFSGTTGNDSPDHTHGYSLATTDGSQKPAGTGSAPFNTTTGASTGGASTRHQHPFSGAISGTGNQPHANVQPTLVLNAQVKLG